MNFVEVAQDGERAGEAGVKSGNREGHGASDPGCNGASLAALTHWVSGAKSLHRCSYTGALHTWRNISSSFFGVRKIVLISEGLSSFPYTLHTF